MKLPIIGHLLRKPRKGLSNKPKTFKGSIDYWIHRYESGSNSGPGSYNKLAKFKAEVLNNFVKNNNIGTIIEYGCGDGNQLKFMKYPAYIGFDVSPKALSLCRDIFRNDKSKSFILIEEYSNETAELTLSLDVIYHLVEDGVYEDYMNRLFNSADKFVIIYSTNTNNNDVTQKQHVRHRKFSEWIDENRQEWRLLDHTPNKYPYMGDVKTSSSADFFIYIKKQGL